MKLHRHKWQYLSKEVTTQEVEERKSSYLISFSDVKTMTQEVTHIKRFCKKCGEVNVQTIPGKLLSKDLQAMGYYEN